MKRFISLICAIAMLVCMAPTTAFAEEPDINYTIKTNRETLQKGEKVTVTAGLKSTTQKYIAAGSFIIKYLSLIHI